MVHHQIILIIRLNYPRSLKDQPLRLADVIFGWKGTQCNLQALLQKLRRGNIGTKKTRGHDLCSTTHSVPNMPIIVHTMSDGCEILINLKGGKHPILLQAFNIFQPFPTMLVDRIWLFHPSCFHLQRPRLRPEPSHGIASESPHKPLRSKLGGSLPLESYIKRKDQVYGMGMDGCHFPFWGLSQKWLVDNSVTENHIKMDDLRVSLFQETTKQSFNIQKTILKAPRNKTTCALDLFNFRKIASAFALSNLRFQPGVPIPMKNTNTLALPSSWQNNPQKMLVKHHSLRKPWLIWVNSSVTVFRIPEQFSHFGMVTITIHFMPVPSQ